MRKLLLLLTLLLALPAKADPSKPIQVSSGAYHAVTPPGWDGTSPLPVVVFFHGYGQTGQVVATNDRLTGPFGANGVLLIAPTGLQKSWGHVGSPRRLRDENAFVDEILADVKGRYPIDENRIWASGFSQGGSMAWDVACYRADRFDAVFPVAGAFWRPHPSTCTSGPVNLFHTHGTGDTVVPMTGRPIREIFHQGDVIAGMALWRQVDGCLVEPDRVETLDDLRCETWTRCSSGKELKLCLHPGGHMIPKGLIDMAVTWANDLSRR
ncbi:MAG: polyhydroxybutyrate depolymerase [Alphaproteobacteria bacterium]|nr:polyhydroxybutyrate depolymerase [Alphaproteobacteria bacterium]